MKVRQAELLAPAGNITCLHAAVSAGADAVYLGVDSFNARRGADNFTLETLEEACIYAHLRGVRVYLALNTAILPSEVDEVHEVARQAYRRGVDAFIVQDIGLATELLRLIPQTELHISTQMNIHSLVGIDAAAKLGASRVTLARELSLEKIKVLSDRAAEHAMEIEVFTHGALCVSYSGQCFMSSMIGGRSANRGLCAQACRLPYSLHNKALKKTLPCEGDHLLSPKDLCTIDIVPQMIKAGVHAFKIEGRMKSPEYVYAVTSIYRRALDSGIQGVKKSNEEDKRVLAEVFSRGFTTAYLEGNRSNEIMSYGRPNNRGAFIGRVTSVKDEKIRLTTEAEIVKGDVLEFWTNKGHFTHTVDQLDNIGSQEVQLYVFKPLTKGDRVFRVRSTKAAFADDGFAPRIPIEGRVTLHRGQSVTMHFQLVHPLRGDLTMVYTEGPLVEAARTKSITPQEVTEHINRLGNTPFVLEQLDVEVDEGVGIGFSQLHKMRSAALEELQEKILEPYSKRVLHKYSVRPATHPAQSEACKVVAWATNPACARAAKRAGAEAIYVPALNYKRGQAVIAGQLSSTAESAGYPKQSIIALPVLDHESVGNSLEQRASIDVQQFIKQGKPLYVENLGHLVLAQQQGALCEVGSHIPVLNRDALYAVAKLGAQRVWLSPELSLEHINELGQESSIPLGITVVGHHELMTTEHCLLMSQGSCAEKCTECPRRKSPHYLKDRKGYEFPVITDCLGRSHLYNAVEFDIAHMVPELLRAKVSSLMIDTTLMNVAEVTKAVERVVRARDIGIKSSDKVSKKEGATTGHIFRGVS